MIKNKSKQTNMKQILQSIIMAALGLSLLTSCKKDKDKDPDLTVLRTDSVFLGTTRTTDTIDVLANDTYFDLSQFTVSQSLKIITQSKVVVKVSSNFYGVQRERYDILDKNGSKTGYVEIVRGNTEQRKAAAVLNSTMNNFTLPLYAIDHDTSGVYQGGFSNQYIYRLNSNIIISFPALGATIPAVQVDDYNSILADGTVSGTDDNNNPIFYKIQDGFTAQAKTLDGKRTVTVTGYTITYQGHTLDYINNVPAQ